MAPRLPVPGSDSGQWGDVLNEYLSVEHDSSGALRKAADIADAKQKADAAETPAGSQSRVDALSARIAEGYVAKEGLDNATAGLIGSVGTSVSAALNAAYVTAGPLGFLIDAMLAPGIVGDGVTDDLAGLQALLETYAGFGPTLLVGRHFLSGTLRPAAGTTIRGRNDHSGFLLPVDAVIAAVTVDSVERVVVADLTVTALGTQTLASGAAVSVSGSSANIEIRNVRAVGMHDGFRVDGGLGTMPGTARHVRLVACRAESTYTYGYRIDDVDGLELLYCSSEGSGADAIKLRKRARNWNITGGHFTGSVGGDGIDAYAGGESGTISGADFSGNTINGMSIKTDELNRSDPASYGMPKSITLIGVRADNNGGIGLGIHRTGYTDDVTNPLVTRVTVLGGSFSGNAAHGVFVRARSVVLSGIQAARNRGNGIRVEAAALDVSIISPQVSGNGLRDTVTDGISVAGARVQIIGGASLGPDPDAATSDADLAAGTKSQRFGLRLEATAAGAVIMGLTLKHNRLAPLSDSTTDSTILGGVSDDAAAAVLNIPNARGISGHKADGTLIPLFLLTAANSLNIANAGVTSTSLLGPLVNVFGILQAIGGVKLGSLAGDPTILKGSGSPEGVTAAPPGSAFHSSDGNIYRKSAGSGSTGWVTT